MNPATRKPVGRTTLAVTQMGLGGAPFGNAFSAVSDESVSDVIALAFAAGIRYFDTAPLYGRGLSETRLGAGLARVSRADVVISSKVGYTLVPRSAQTSRPDIYVDTPAYDVLFDYSRDAVRRSLDESLRRLNTGRLDIVFVHDPDEGAGLDARRDPYAHSHFAEVMAQTYPALDDLRAQGVIRAVGVGMNQWQMLCDFARAGDFDCFLLAGRYTLLEQGALSELLPLCAQKRISVMIGAPFNSGILATGALPGAYYNYAPAPAAVLERVRRIEAVCARHQVPLPAAALQFPFGHPTVTSIIPGARSAAELEANLRLFRQPISDDFWAELKSLSLLSADAPAPIATAERHDA